MQRSLTTALVGAAALASALAVEAGAFSGGIGDLARVGCGGTPGQCHSTVVPPSLTTELILQGLPEGGYVPGCTYHLQVWVLGIALPLGVQYFPLGGFNLEATAGSFPESSVVLNWTTLQVTHRYRDPSDLGNQNRFTWPVDWTAPLAGTGDVLFYLAGNLANGNGGRDDGDLWSLSPPETLSEGSGGTCPAE